MKSKISSVVLSLILIASFGRLQAQTYWKPPRPQKTVLANGLTLLVVERHNLPVVVVKAMIRGGSACDPGELPGLANFTAEILDKGTKIRTAQDIAQMFDWMGAVYENSCDYDASYFSLAFLSRDLGQVLPVFMDLLQNPKVDSAEVERLRNQLLSNIQDDRDQPETIGRQAFDSLLYRGHPYSRPVYGQEAALARIGASDIVSFHGKYFVPNNTVIAVVGDIKPAKISELLKKLTKNWLKAEVPPVIFDQIPKINRPGLQMIHRPISQAYVVLGFLGPKRLDPDYQAARLMNYILGGGGFVSRLFTKIRVQQGLAYDVDSYFSPRLDYGPYAFTVQTKCQTADTALKTMLLEIERIQKEPVSDQELLEAKAYFRGSYPFRYETNEQIAGQILGAELYGLSPDQVIKDLEAIQKVTKEDLLQSAQRLLKPRNYIVAMATDTAITKINIPGLTVEKK